MNNDANIMKDLHAICHKLSYITITLSLADWKLDQTHSPSYEFIQVWNKFYLIYYIYEFSNTIY